VVRAPELTFSDPFGLCPKDKGGDGNSNTISDCPEGTAGYREFRNPQMESPLVDPVAILTGFVSGFVRGFFAKAAAGAVEGAASSELGATFHGGLRLADASRLNDAASKAVIANATRAGLQRDGARVYIQEVGGRFNLVVMGERGVITNLKTISEKSLTRLAKNYGYEHLLP
jgi:hypothetical protein